MNDEAASRKRSIIFAGIGTALAETAKFHSSLLFVSDLSTLLIDCGDGISFALAELQVSPLAIDALLITHFHPDHYSGFPSLINQMKITGRQQPLKVYSNIADISFLREFLFHSYIFEERLGFAINWIGVRENEHYFISKDLSFLCRKNNHLDKYRIYDTSHKLSFVSLSVLLNVLGARIYYSGDISSESELQGLDDFAPHIIICEAAHVLPADALKVTEGFGAKKIIFTHYRKSADLEHNFAENVELATFGLKVPLDNYSF